MRGTQAFEAGYLSGHESRVLSPESTFLAGPLSDNTCDISTLEDWPLKPFRTSRKLRMRPRKDCANQPSNQPQLHFARGFAYNYRVDAHTLDKLDFDAVRQLLAAHVSCDLGRGMALKIEPADQLELIEQWQIQFRELLEAASLRDLPPFGGVHDIREAIRVAVPPHCLEPDDLMVVAETLAATHNLVEWAAVLPEHLGQLRGLCEQIGDFHSIAEAIRRVIGPDGQVRDDASTRLNRIRIEISQARIDVGHVFDRLLRDRNLVRWLRYPQATFHDDRLVLPLSSEHRGRIPGIVHRSSDSGATLFVEPAAAVELNNRIISLKQEEHAEIGRLLMQLTHQVHLNQQPVLETLEALAVLDLVVGKVRLARSYALTSPQISPDGKLVLRQARHLLLIDLQKQEAREGRKREVVPIDVRLGDDFDLMVITGPNTGGKTVTLKTVGLACLMAQAGLPVPAAEGSQVPLYRDILIDIGDEQSLQQSLSTFSAHLARLLVMLKKAGPGMLILIDELGAGTDPDEGAALGRAIVEELLQRRCMAMVTTHLGVLKSVAFAEARAENACVDFDNRTLQPTYRLLIGEPGNSNAINIATRLGLPERVIKAARSHMDQSQQQLTRAIQGTLASRRQAEHARTQADTARVEAERQAEASRRETLALQARQVEFDRWVSRISTLRPGDKVHVNRFDRPGTVVRVLLHKQLAVVNVGSMEMEIPLRELNLG